MADFKKGFDNFNIAFQSIDTHLYKLYEIYVKPTAPEHVAGTSTNCGRDVLRIVDRSPANPEPADRPFHRATVLF